MWGARNRMTPNLSAHELLDALAFYEDDELHFQREVSCFITDSQGILSLTTNNSGGHVEFDFFSIWEAIKRLETRPNRVCMIHTHPEGFANMSGIDRNMLPGWRLAMGVPVHYLVVSNTEFSYYVCDRNAERKVHISNVSDDVQISVMADYLLNILYGISKTPYDYDAEKLNQIAAAINSSQLNPSCVFCDI